MEKKEPEVFYPTSQHAWRQWLEKNHVSEQAVWLVYYSKKSAIKSLTWSEAVDVALCYGWIDSKHIKIDEQTSHQYFTKRKPQSTWSKVNKEKVVRLIEHNLMTEAGMKCIEVAKQNGSWTILDDVEELIVPADLDAAFSKHPGTKDYFLSQSKSARKFMLSTLVLAKRPETRQKRIDDIIVKTTQNL